MGNESSREIDDSVPPETLADRSLAGVAEYIKSGSVKRIVVMTGAGISTAAGIPDFRSPKTGLYANLERLDLPHAEAVFDIGYFRRNPEPFYVLAKELYPGNFFPTVSHAFVALLASKGLLQMLFTQNIDCLERAAGVPADKIVEAHGSFATQRCIECKIEFPDEFMREYVSEGKVPYCLEKGCSGTVKPDIVFFGEALPERFGQNGHIPAMADLALVIGTSLTVWPFAGLPQTVRGGVPRVLFNLENVNGLGTRADDVLELGPCDAGIRKLADLLGWRDELEEFWTGVVGEKEAERQRSSPERLQEELDDEVQKLADEVNNVLNIDDGEKISDGKLRKLTDEQGNVFYVGGGEKPTTNVKKGFVQKMAKWMEHEIGPSAPRTIGESGRGLANEGVSTPEKLSASKKTTDMKETTEGAKDAASKEAAPKEELAVDKPTSDSRSVPEATPLSFTKNAPRVTSETASDAARQENEDPAQSDGKKFLVQSTTCPKPVL